MCWMCSKAEKKIVEEDIKVFKIGESHGGMFYSMYKGFKYQLNKLYSINIRINKDDDGVFVGSKGFHSYDPFIANLEIYDKDVFPRWVVYAGVRKLDVGNIGYVKAECVIPKGSEYYENENGEIISNQIIIKNVEQIWN